MIKRVRNRFQTINKKKWAKQANKRLTTIIRIFLSSLYRNGDVKQFSEETTFLWIFFSLTFSIEFVLEWVKFGKFKKQWVGSLNEQFMSKAEFMLRE